MWLSPSLQDFPLAEELVAEQKWSLHLCMSSLQNRTEANLGGQESLPCSSRCTHKVFSVHVFLSVAFCPSLCPFISSYLVVAGLEEWTFSPVQYPQPPLISWTLEQPLPPSQECDILLCKKTSGQCANQGLVRPWGQVHSMVLCKLPGLKIWDLCQWDRGVTAPF